MQYWKRELDFAHAWMKTKKQKRTLGISYHSCCSSEKQEGEFSTHVASLGDTGSNIGSESEQELVGCDYTGKMLWEGYSLTNLSFPIRIFRIFQTHVQKSGKRPPWRNPHYFSTSTSGPSVESDLKNGLSRRAQARATRQPHSVPRLSKAMYLQSFGSHLRPLQDKHAGHTKETCTQPAVLFHQGWARSSIISLSMATYRTGGPLLIPADDLSCRWLKGSQQYSTPKRISSMLVLVSLRASHYLKS